MRGWYAIFAGAATTVAVGTLAVGTIDRVPWIFGIAVGAALTFTLLATRPMRDDRDD